MKVTLISNNQHLNNYRVNPTFKSKEITIFRSKQGKISGGNSGKLNKYILAFLTLMGLSALISCNKVSSSDDNTEQSAINRDLVDFAFRDMANHFGLDTTGYTKILRQSYPLNNGDYTLDTFQPIMNADTMRSRGIFYCAKDNSTIPYESVWTKTTHNGQDAVKVDYFYPWENRAPHMPEPKQTIIIPGAEDDNAIKMLIHPGTGLFNANVDVIGDSAYYKVEDMDIKNPFSVKIEQNY